MLLFKKVCGNRRNKCTKTPCISLKNRLCAVFSLLIIWLCIFKETKPIRAANKKQKEKLNSPSLLSGTNRKQINQLKLNFNWVSLHFTSFSLWSNSEICMNPTSSCELTPAVTWHRRVCVFAQVLKIKQERITTKQREKTTETDWRYDSTVERLLRKRSWRRGT